MQRNRAATKLMISGLVPYPDANDAGLGFYALAQQLGELLRDASSGTKWEFWSARSERRLEADPRLMSAMRAETKDMAVTGSLQQTEPPLLTA